MVVGSSVGRCVLGALVTGMSVAFLVGDFVLGGLVGQGGGLRLDVGLDVGAAEL